MKTFFSTFDQYAMKHLQDRIEKRLCNGQISFCRSTAFLFLNFSKISLQSPRQG
jgi:hypothetical protein